MMTLALLAAMAAGGDETPELSAQIVGMERETYRFGMTFGAGARMAFPFGTADPGNVFVGNTVIVIEDHLSYVDLFNVGVGVTLEADLMFRPPPPVPGGPPWEHSPAMGAYVAFEWDWYGGNSAVDASGTRIRPDTLEIPSIFVGFKAAGTVREDLFGDLRFGVGTAHYPSLDAEIRPPGGFERTTEFFQETWTVAVELKMHFGYRLGPAAFTFGLGGRLFGPPNMGSRVDLDPSVFFNLDLEVGFELGF
jgi:hypothetical protein